MHAQSFQSCPTLCDPMDCSPPGSSVHGILQARILEWVATPFSRVLSWLRDGTQVSCGSCTAGRFFTNEPPRSSKHLSNKHYLVEHVSLEWFDKLILIFTGKTPNGICVNTILKFHVFFKTLKGNWLQRKGLTPVLLPLQGPVTLVGSHTCSLVHISFMYVKAMEFWPHTGLC